MPLNGTVQLTASSREPGYPASSAYLESPNGWKPLSGETATYLRINFSHPSNVTQITTQWYNASSEITFIVEYLQETTDLVWQIARTETIEDVSIGKKKLLAE